MKVSYTRVQSYRKCPQQHYYKYVLNLDKIQPELPLIKGSILHNMIESYLKEGTYIAVLEDTKKKYEQLFEEEKEKYGDIVNDLDRLMKGWIKKWGNDHLTYLAIEVPFKVNLFEPDELDFFTESYRNLGRMFPKEIQFVGKIDAIAQEQNGMRYLVEHKVMSTIPEDGIQITDLQTALYVKALKLMDEPDINGILWDYVKSKPPVFPELLRSGRLSVAKACDTDEDTYMEAIKQYGLSPEPYAEYLASLRERKANAFYRRNYMPNPYPGLVKIMWQDFQEDAIDIAVEGPRNRRKNLTKDCKFCAYQPLCFAELMGNDIDFVLKSQYEQRQKVVI